MTDDLVNVADHIVEKDGYYVFVAPEDGEFTFSRIDDWSGEKPTGWGGSVPLQENDELLLGFVPEGDRDD